MLSMRSAPGVAQGWVTFTAAATWQAQAGVQQRQSARFRAPELVSMQSLQAEKEWAHVDGDLFTS